MTNKSINKELKEILSQYRTDFESLSSQSRKNFMENLPEGAQIPKEGIIYSDQAKNSFSQACASYRQRIKDILDGSLNELKRQMTTAPSEDAVRTISMLKMRSNVSKEEMSALFDRYGDNVQAARALASIANDNHIYEFSHDPYEERISDIENLGRSLDKAMGITLEGAAQGTEGKLAFMEMTIDNLFPAD